MRDTCVAIDDTLGEAAVTGDLPTQATPVISFEAWYRAEYRPVVALVSTLVKSRTVAEELAQDAFLEAHRKWADVSTHPNPSGWVRTVVLNKARSGFRRRGAEARAYRRHFGRDEADAVVLVEPHDQFWAEVRALPRRQAQTVALHYVDDLPVDEIADILEISPGSVKTHLHRARATLATRLSVETSEET